MSDRSLHVVQLLIRRQHDGQVEFLLYPHEHWRSASGQPYWTLPTKLTVADPLAPFLRGTPIDEFVGLVAREDLQLDDEAYAIEQELEAVETELPSPTHRDADGQPLLTHYTLYPIDLWVRPDQREPLRSRLKGEWFSADRAKDDARLSPTARTVLVTLRTRETRFQEDPPEDPRGKLQAGAVRRLFGTVPDRPGVDALANKWLASNGSGVRHLPRETLDAILDAGSRAFNLRVADPYLRYQMQGVGFTWSFFTHKDPQDCHVHGAPVVEI
jgi:hypothetical protein